MTNQSTHEQWTSPTRTLERAGPDQTEPESSTQDGTAPDLPTGERSAEDGVVYHSSGHDEAAPADVEQADSGYAVGVAPMPDAEPGLDLQPAEQHDSVAVAAAPDVAGSGELLPGEVPTELVALFDGAVAQGFRDRWQQLQLRFVDDPHTVAAQAGVLADEVATTLRDAVDQHRMALEDWQSDDGVDAHFGDTERLRVAVRRYRDFVDRLLAM